MKNFKSEKGAITIIVLVSVLFFVSFLISSYVIVANKVQAQKEIVQQTREIYENYNIEDSYSSYFGENIIPISTKEQLLAIGTGKIINIDNKYYTFSNDEKTVYVLKNDIEFNAYEESLNARVNGMYYWTPIGERTDLESKFEGNGNRIVVNYKDAENDEYSVVYSEKDGYKELEYKVKIIPRSLTEDGEIVTQAKMYTSIENKDFIMQDGTGENEITVKRLVQTNVYAACEGYRDSGNLSIYIENPEKIQSYDLVLGKYYFTINATPSNAVVTINGKKTNTVAVTLGETVNWKVEATNYTTKQGTEIISDDKTLNVDLDIIKYVLTINPSPSDANVTISSNGEVLASGTGAQSVEVIIGTILNYSVSRTYYYPKSGVVTMNSDSTLPITLEQKPEKTLVVTPTSVSTSGTYYAKNDAVASHSNNTYYAYTIGSGALVWNFNASSIMDNSKITSIFAQYRLGTTIAGMDAEINLKANNTTCLSTKVDVPHIVVTGELYETYATTMPSASDIKTSLTLSAKRSGTSGAYIRFYGATLTIKYIEP